MVTPLQQATGINVLSLPGPATPGNTLVWAGSHRHDGLDTDPNSLDPSWTLALNAIEPTYDDRVAVYYKLAGVGPDDNFGGVDNNGRGVIYELPGVWVPSATELDSQEHGPPGGPFTNPPVAGPISPAVGSFVVGVAGAGQGGGWDAGAGSIHYTTPSGFTEDADNPVFDGHPSTSVGHLSAVGGSVTYNPVCDVAGPWAAVVVAFVPGGPEPPPTPGPIPGVYDKDDVFLDTLEGAFDVRLRVELNGVGAGAFRIRRDDPKATAEILRPGNFVRVKIPQIDGSVAIVGFFLDDGDFKLVASSETGGEVLSFSGKGTPSYLTHAIWLAESFEVNWWPAYKETSSGVPGPTVLGALALAGDPGWYYHYSVSGSTVTGRTRFHTGGVTAYYDQRKVFTRADGSKITLVQFSDTVYNNFWVHPFGAGVRDYRKKNVFAYGKSVLMSEIGTGTMPGLTLLTMVNEAQNANRPINPYPLLTFIFDDLVDSDGNPWSTTDALAGVSADLGEDFLSTIAKLEGTGVLDVDVRPDFVLEAWNAPHGRDLASASFAANKVRFVKGVNIADDLSREYTDPPVGTFAEAVGSEDGAIGRALLPTAADWRPREIGVRGDTADSAALDALAAAELDFRLLHSDAVGFNVNTPIIGREDDLSGAYVPGPSWSSHGKYWIGDFVRLHTGTGENDFNEETLRIAAITLSWTESNDLRTIVELISSFGGLERLGYGEGGGSAGGSSGGGGAAGGGSGSVVADLYQPISERDRPNGYPSLDELGKVPFTELDLDWHPSVRVAATGNVTLASLDAGDALDGVTLAEGDDVLLPVQTAGAENGLYTIQEAGTAPTRRGDFDDSLDVVGAVVLVREGTVNGGTLWRSTNTTDPTIGTTALTWTKYATALTVQDEGGALASAAEILNFVGAGVVASGTGATKTISIPGGITGGETSVWKPVMANNPNVVTADGSAVWTVLVTSDGEPIMAYAAL